MSESEFRVIEILDEYSILINYGMRDGASEDDEVRIISIGPEVIDPITKQNLGTLDSVKAVLTIVTAYNNFSLCQKITTTTKNLLLGSMSQFQTTSKEIKPLSVDTQNISKKKLPDDKTIRIGDIVEIL